MIRLSPGLLSAVEMQSIAYSLTLEMASFHPVLVEMEANAMIGGSLTISFWLRLSIIMGLGSIL
jgi:hypothetical protein